MNQNDLRSQASQHADAVAQVGVEIISVATAVPKHVITQEDAAWRARKIFPQYARLDALYTNTGIDKRYAVEPVTWYLSEHSWEERTAIYQRNALDLLEQVSLQAIKEAGAYPARYRCHRHQHDHRPLHP
jgi:alkylresorcinol/alkylpyrone synthase